MEKPTLKASHFVIRISGHKLKIGKEYVFTKNCFKEKRRTIR